LDDFLGFKVVRFGTSSNMVNPIFVSLVVQKAFPTYWAFFKPNYSIVLFVGIMVERVGQRRRSRERNSLDDSFWGGSFDPSRHLYSKRWE